MIEMNPLKLFCFMLFENFITRKWSKEVTYELSNNGDTCRVTCGSTELICTHLGDDVLTISLQRGSKRNTYTCTTEGITATLTHMPSDNDDDIYLSVLAKCSSLYNLALHIADDMQLNIFGVEE